MYLLQIRVFVFVYYCASVLNVHQGHIFVAVNSVLKSFTNLEQTTIIYLTSVLSTVILNLCPGSMLGSEFTSCNPIWIAGSCPRPPGHGPLKGNSPRSHISLVWSGMTVVLGVEVLTSVIPLVRLRTSSD